RRISTPRSLDPRRRQRGLHATKEPHHSAIQRRMILAEIHAFGALAPPVKRFELLDGLLFSPLAALAMFRRIDPGGAQCRIVSAEIPDGGGVKRGVVLLDRPAVERLAIAGQA